MIKFALAQNDTLLVPCRPSDAAKLVESFGENYGTVYRTDDDGFKYRGFPLSALPMLCDECAVSIER